METHHSPSHVEQGPRATVGSLSMVPTPTTAPRCLNWPRLALFS